MREWDLLAELCQNVTGREERRQNAVVSLSTPGETRGVTARKLKDEPEDLDLRHGRLGGALVPDEEGCLVEASDGSPPGEEAARAEGMEGAEAGTTAKIG